MKTYHLFFLFSIFVCIFFGWGFMFGQYFGKKSVDQYRQVAKDALEVASSALELKRKTTEQWEHCFASWQSLETKYNEHKVGCPHLGEADHRAAADVF